LLAIVRVPDRHLGPMPHVDMSARSGTPGAIGFLKDFDDGPVSAPTIVSAT